MSACNTTKAAHARKLDNQVKALELRRSGRGYVEIAAAIGISKSQAHNLVKAGLAGAREQIASSSEDLRAEEVSRLDAMLSGVWADARRGHLGAVDRVLKLMERRAKLLGLDAPAEQRHTGAGGGPIQLVGMSAAEFRAMAQQVIAET